MKQIPFCNEKATQFNADLWTGMTQRLRQMVCTNSGEHKVNWNTKLADPSHRHRLIKSVGNIKQITRAMEMVASTKLRRFQDRAIASRPYSEEIAGLMARLSASIGDEIEDTSLFEPGAGDRTLVLLVSSDRGLCGAYNTTLFRALEEWLEGRDVDKHDFYVYGRKGAQKLVKAAMG